MFRFEAAKGLSKHLVLSEEGRVASRENPTDHFDGATAVVFPALLPASRPYFEVILREVFPDKKWAGCLMLRFVSDPSNVPHVPGANEPIDGVIDVLKPGDRVGLLCDSKGRSHYTLNGGYLGVIDFLPPVDRQQSAALYGVVDIYANTASIALPKDVVWEPWSFQSHRLFPQCFREQVFALLCCHRSPNATAINTLPKWVLLDIIAILATQHTFADSVSDDVFAQAEAQETLPPFEEEVVVEEDAVEEEEI